MAPAPMYLIDTNVISELRKKAKANPGVIEFFRQADQQRFALYLSVITVGEIRRGIELIRYRADDHQAMALQEWLEAVLDQYRDSVLDFTEIEAQVWGKLRVPHPENAIDKQIAATALTHDLILVTRNTDDFQGLGLKLHNPFSH